MVKLDVSGGFSLEQWQFTCLLHGIWGCLIPHSLTYQGSVWRDVSLSVSYKFILL